VSGVPAGLLFAAGAAAAFNPCGVAMLPGYVALLLGPTAQRGRHGWVLGLGAGLAMTAGFLTVFALAGMAGSGTGRALGRWMPWVTVAIGAALLAAAVLQWTGRPLPGLAAAERLGDALGRAGPSRGLGAAYVYGVAYALASLGCTLPLFLALVAGAVGSGSPRGAAVAVLAYGAGMGLVATVLSVLAGGLSRVLAAQLASRMPAVQRASAAVLGAVGAYLLYYWLLGPGALVRGL
jgi:cytochrome c-type biogenesis protein